jgi:hypothetical protein
MSWAGGSTRAWRIMRAAILQRDALAGCRAHRDGWCARAGRATPHRCTDAVEHAHHTHGRRVTGDDPRYIVSSCEACNLHIGDPSRAADPPVVPVTRWY